MPTNTSPVRELSPEEQDIDAALAEITEAGLAVMRNTRRLAAIEADGLDELAQARAAAKQGLIDPPDLQAAIQAGQDADDCKAAYAEAAASNAALTNTYDKLARALRYTLALRLRLLSGRPFRPLPPLASGPAPEPGHPPPAPGPRSEDDTGIEPADCPDLYDASEDDGTERPGIERPRTERPGTERYETGDELAALTKGEVLHLIARELSGAMEAADRLVPRPDADPDAPARPPGKAPPPAFHYQPGKTRPFPVLTNLGTRPQPPDT